VSTERKQMMLSDDPGAVALGAYCGACHAAPLPMRHTMAEWSPVVARMELHRLQRGFDPIPANDRAALLGFLQAGAKP